MADKTAIEWTDATWSPITGCTRVSPGCEHCYAETLSRRLEAMGTEKYAGTTRKVGGETRWTGAVRFHPEALETPLRWRKPRRIFVNSMSDTFHPDVTDEQIDQIFAVMAACPDHTFQVLTKRPERAADYLTYEPRWAQIEGAAVDLLGRENAPGLACPDPSPLPNVWLGTSVEDQATADKRIPHLLQCPAAVRFVSYEPALSAVDFLDVDGNDVLSAGKDDFWNGTGFRPASLDWLIVGGESGPGSRPCDVAWITSAIDQCRAAGVACFVKQLGRRVLGSAEGFIFDRYILCDGSEWAPPIIGWDQERFERENADLIVGFRPVDAKGGDWLCWPEHLRVREFPV